mmetsp:Transcript_14829/g.25460  ORF Transcript_14829/g.25460 Transcript_14829/m.25460 type:complete len:222 (+) Transcript_14829:572-1237(+)
MAPFTKSRELHGTVPSKYSLPGGPATSFVNTPVTTAATIVCWSGNAFESALNAALCHFSHNDGASNSPHSEHTSGAVAARNTPIGPFNSSGKPLPVPSTSDNAPSNTVLNSSNSVWLMPMPTWISFMSGCGSSGLYTLIELSVQPSAVPKNLTRPNTSSPASALSPTKLREPAGLVPSKYCLSGAPSAAAPLVNTSMTTAVSVSLAFDRPALPAVFTFATI